MGFHLLYRKRLFFKLLSSCLLLASSLFPQPAQACSNTPSACRDITPSSQEIQEDPHSHSVNGSSEEAEETTIPDFFGSDSSKTDIRAGIVSSPQAYTSYFADFSFTEIDDTLLCIDAILSNVSGCWNFSFASPANTEILLPERFCMQNGQALAEYARTGSASFTASLTNAGKAICQAGKTITIQFYLRKPKDLNEIILTFNNTSTVRLRTWAYYQGNTGWNGIPASAREDEVLPLKGSTETRIARLKQMFPQGKYWNHPASRDLDYRPDSWTDFPCTTHSGEHTGAYLCNYFDGMPMCDGFAGMCYFLFHGLRPRSIKNEIIQGDRDLKVGDVIYTHVATDGPNGHMSFVWKISGDTVYKLEGNYAGNCKIWQSAVVKRSDIIEHYTPAARTVSYRANGGTGTMPSKSCHYADGLRIDPLGFEKNGCQFAGWSVLDEQTGWYLYENDRGERMYFQNDETAAWNGYDMKVLVPNCAKIDSIPSDSQQIVLEAQWILSSPNGVWMHRLYNSNSGEHFYTQSEQEYLSLTKGGWTDEGLGWKAPKQGAPVYRLYNKNAGDHHYTIDPDEKNMLIKAGWRDEGIGWYSASSDGLPLYRQYNPNAKAGSHNYTLDKAENDLLVRLGWRAEGIGWYGLKE